MTKRLFLITLSLNIFLSCTKKETDISELMEAGYLTENVIIVVIDGPRYSETWGDSSKQYIPRLANHLSKSGVVNTSFFNNGPTHTLGGHVSITTGFYQDIDNRGFELPSHPSFFQYWNQKESINSNQSWIIASKDKLEVLNNCSDSTYNDHFNPSTNCGIDGLGSGYRHDTITFRILKEVLTEHHPKLVLVNFREPDFSGHAGNWSNYLEGIKNTDEYTFEIWQFIEQDPIYQNKTTLFITNDHGRHLNDVADGFISHGDDCLGCRHINLFAYGPDFKQNVIIDIERELIDISATIGELLQLDSFNTSGNIMVELFK